MSNLEDDLRELADLLPGLPGEATEASQAASALLTATRPLLEDLDALDGAADEVVAVASALGQAFAKHAQELEQHLRGVSAEVNESWATARKAVESAAGGTTAASLGLSNAKGTLLTALEAADQAVDPTAEAEAATASLVDATLEALRDVNNQGVELQLATTTYHALMTDRVPRVNVAAEALQTRVQQLHDRIAAGAEQLVTALAEKARDLDEALREALTTLAADLEDQRDTTAEALREEVAAKLAEAGDAANQALAALGRAAEERDRRLVELRAQFQQAFAEVDEASRWLPAPIEQIHEAYQKVDGL
jgi:uncharacterized protein YoxC